MYLVGIKNKQFYMLSAILAVFQQSVCQRQDFRLYCPFYFICRFITVVNGFQKVTLCKQIEYKSTSYYTEWNVIGFVSSKR